MSAVKERWRCSECGGLHIYRYSAETCCVPDISLVYLCPDCEEEHDTEIEAIACCADSEVIKEDECLIVIPPPCNSTEEYVAKFNELNGLIP
jgi:hypothetical protein